MELLYIKNANSNLEQKEANYIQTNHIEENLVNSNIELVTTTSEDEKYHLIVYLSLRCIIKNVNI